jgi:hypothetical protein
MEYYCLFLLHGVLMWFWGIGGGRRFVYLYESGGLVVPCCNPLVRFSSFSEKGAA